MAAIIASSRFNDEFVSRKGSAVVNHKRENGRIITQPQNFFFSCKWWMRERESRLCETKAKNEHLWLFITEIIINTSRNSICAGYSDYFPSRIWWLFVWNCNHSFWSPTHCSEYKLVNYYKTTHVGGFTLLLRSFSVSMVTIVRSRSVNLCREIGESTFYFVLFFFDSLESLLQFFINTYNNNNHM